MEQQILNSDKIKSLIPYNDILIENVIFHNNCLTGKLLKIPKKLLHTIYEEHHYRQTLAFHDYLEQIQYIFIACIIDKKVLDIRTYSLKKGYFDYDEEKIKAFINGKESLFFEMVLIDTKLVKDKLRVNFNFVIHGYGQTIATVFVEKSE